MASIPSRSSACTSAGQSFAYGDLQGVVDPDERYTVVVDKIDRTS